MKNEMSPVTSVYFVALIKAYLRGTKTRQEVIQDLYNTTSLLQKEEDNGKEVTQLLFKIASEINENYYQDIVTGITHASDTTPTREGMVHQLQAMLTGFITPKQLYQWATWHNNNEADTDSGSSFFDDIAVDYFCTQLLPASFEELTTAQYKQALKIFQSTHHNTLKDKVALVLLSDKEKQRFLFYLGDYIQGHTSPEQLDVYLLHKFGMDHHSFPYMSSLSAIMQEPGKLSALLNMAAMIEN
ncbi:hypothetical protein CLV51_103554 [Chitinophaga niastensis]|uniref:Uncharacterized protein n=1 Tax=Chitinophaga niastensis TaxID=536980 RepID=A0A2P8HK26_CHINA|nr:hypothetical protein [Chitinophaga niastensis]PSL46573.1 hypothetical protein CLV51_103554 [Chitinophaga niastensis]